MCRLLVHHWPSLPRMQVSRSGVIGRFPLASCESGLVAASSRGSSEQQETSLLPHVWHSCGRSRHHACSNLPPAACQAIADLRARAERQAPAFLRRHGIASGVCRRRRQLFVIAAIVCCCRRPRTTYLPLLRLPPPTYNHHVHGYPQACTQPAAESAQPRCHQLGQDPQLASSSWSGDARQPWSKDREHHSEQWLHRTLP